MTAAPSDVFRADWRFLLPDARPESVVVLRHPAAEPVERALRAAGLELADPGRGTDGAPVVFAHRPDGGALDRALALRATDGSLVVESTSRTGRRRIVRRLRRAGLSVRVYGCWPRCAAATRYVPLDDSAEILESALAAKNPRRRLVGAALARLGLGPMTFAESTIVATPGPGAPAPVRVAFGADAEPTATMTLLTPRFRSSRHVLAFPTGGPAPRLVTKTPRLPDDDAELAAEVRGLTSIEGLLPPRSMLVADVERFGQRWVVQSRVVGEPLSRRHVIRRPDLWLAAGHDWLRLLPTGDVSRPDADGRSDRLLRPALELVAAAATREPALRPLVADAERALDVIGATDLPVCAEHGDFRPPNLVIVGKGVLAAVDWELADRHGFPLYDLLFFHDYVHGIVPGHRPVLDAAAVQFLNRAGLDAALLGPLASAMRTRQLANFVRRRSSGVEAIAHSDVARSWFADLADERSPAEVTAQ